MRPKRAHVQRIGAIVRVGLGLHAQRVDAAAPHVDLYQRDGRWVAIGSAGADVVADFPSTPAGWRRAWRLALAVLAEVSARSRPRKARAA